MTDSSEPTPRAAPRPSRREQWRAWPRWLRRAISLGIVGALVAVAVLVGAVTTVRASLPQTDGDVVLAGLTAPVTIRRDDAGIPSIEASDDRDLFMAQGYAAAQDRFYAMDVARRYASGTLAELIGETALAGDKLVRTLGWRRTATEELSLLDAGTTRALEAYADGVNAWLRGREGRDLSLEYVLLEGDGLAIDPPAWEPVDSLAVLKAWAWSMSGPADREVETALLVPRQAADAIEELFPAYDYQRHPPVITGGGVVDGVFEPGASESGSRAPRRAAPAWALSPAAAATGAAGVRQVGDLDLGPAGPGTGRSVTPGGTAVAVAGDRSASGAPLLVDHVIGAVSLPGPLTQVALTCSDVGFACPYDVAGFALEGVPGVLVGRTEGLAWGLSSFRADTTDLFLERVRGASYVEDTDVLPLEQRDEQIVVAGMEEPFTFTVRSSARGPLVSDVSPELSTVAANVVDIVDRGAARRANVISPRAAELLASEDESGYALALQWTGAEPGRTMDGLLALNRAADGDALREAAELLAAPTLGLVWADRAGIGYQAAGVVPMRTPANDGRRVVAGWRPSNAWRADPVPYAALPHTEDPESGLIVAADQAAVDADYPFDLGHAWDPGYRSARITELLGAAAEDGPLDIATVRAALSDTRDPLAPTLTPLLLRLLQTSAYASAGQDQLGQWDGRAAADSSGSAYFQAVTRRLLQLTFDDEVRESMSPAGGPRWTAVLEDLLADPTSRWWDDVTTPQVESRDTVLREAQTAAVDDLVRLQARDPRAWTWGHQHALRLSVPAADEIDSPAAGWLLETDPLELAGDGSTGLVTGWDPQAGFEVTSAPLARLAVDMGGPDGGWAALSGVSGHVWSPHLMDQSRVWSSGGLLPWDFDQRREAGGQTLTLTPGSS